MMKSFVCALALLSSAVHAHTCVRSVWVNGVDQGSAVGIREPAHLGAPPEGFNNSPIRNLSSTDLVCNLLGDIPVSGTIKVAPGDTVTFEWGRRSRLDSDNIIETSHHGPGIVWISPNPPSANSWVKLWEKGKYDGNKWFVTTELVQKRAHSLKVPPGLKPGQYLFRVELVTLHEAEVAHSKNPNRGVQLYMSCIQIEVTGSGTVSLPQGVSFPGAYNENDPGLLYNIYSPPSGNYIIPGGPVWSGAAPSIENPSLGTKKGALTGTGFARWIATPTLAGVSTQVYEIRQTTGVNTTTSWRYTPNWSTAYTPPGTTTLLKPGETAGTTGGATPRPTSGVTTTLPVSTTTTVSATPSATGGCSTNGVPKWQQCGGMGYTGADSCAHCGKCVEINPYYSQCQ